MKTAVPLETTHFEPFVPRSILRNRHFQTISGSLPLFAPPRAFAMPATQWRRYPLAGPRGGSVLGLGWWQDGARPRPTAIVVHGLGGSSESLYVVRAAVVLYRAGYNVVRLNMRAAGQGVTDAPTLYHAGLSADLGVVADALAQDARVASTLVLGFSLGGNVVLKAVGEWGASPPAKVVAAATVSAPMDLAATSRLLEMARALPYRVYMLGGLIKQARDFRRLHPERTKYDNATLLRLRTVREYDDAIVAPMHGFADADSYYAAVSSGPFLANARLPLLVVHADDDPVVPGHTVTPFLERAAAPVEVAWSDQGGHVGWLEGLTEAQWVKTWSMERVMRFFARFAELTSGREGASSARNHGSRAVPGDAAHTFR